MFIDRQSRRDAVRVTTLLRELVRGGRAIVVFPEGTSSDGSDVLPFNTPLFERLRACMPKQFRDLENGTKGLGIDVTRDVDRVAMVPGGMAMSGFFEGKPVVDSILTRQGAEPDRRPYRGQTIVASDRLCGVQMGHLVLFSPSGQCEALTRGLRHAP